MSVPVIDLFAGPGGLGEGFSRARTARFEILLSVEKDEMAHETLRLRAAHRTLTRDRKASDSTWALWDSIVESEPWNILFYKLRDSGDAAIRRACAAAQAEALNLELGPSSRQQVSAELRRALASHKAGGGLPRNIVLIGGPPCQAYSIVGRSRNKGVRDYRPEADHRHFLYREYLHVISELRPAVFVMENVKGILTSRVKDRHIFDSILNDLRRPDLAASKGSGPEYVLTSLGGSEGLLDEPAAEDFIVRAEDFGVPQARHRVIILGIRRDVFDSLSHLPQLERATPPSVLDVIGDLPKLRPQLSYRGSGMAWTEAFEDPLFDQAVKEIGSGLDPRALELARLMQQRRAEFRDMKRDRGFGQDRTVRSANRRKPKAHPDWYVDRHSVLLANHECRAHMPSDLIRYLFVAAFGEVYQQSPRLADFPLCLLPDHRNVDRQAVDKSIFKDRFRVQLGDRFSMTVTSHIAKDGHAFIHPDSSQCRSLTVREAARLQTFPDSYVFLGNRTSQYIQVGNAVPPLLAVQFAEIVAEILKSARLG